VRARDRHSREDCGRVGDQGNTPVIKSISLLTRKAGMTHAQLVEHWVEVHGCARARRPGTTARRAVAHRGGARHRPARGWGPAGRGATL